MSGCKNGNCGGCGGALILSPGEIALLKKLGQIPFLPVARTAADAAPIYLEDTDRPAEEYSLILQCLEKRGLISLDYEMPIKNLRSDAYRSYPICGSFALTARGQQVLEAMELQGLDEEA